ncbi:hypothetical protein HAX54_023754 [Datura stramonium]|uniref:Uncharacterized protein n=1 Tax=Datura stramonium TaxID=4076 RepID=A0ABS8S517_DATST|nr:hypothetical protein [Datura stramonium]
MEKKGERRRGRGLAAAAGGFPGGAAAVERGEKKMRRLGFGGGSGGWQWCYFAGVVGVGVRWMFSGQQWTETMVEGERKEFGGCFLEGVGMRENESVV